MAIGLYSLSVPPITAVISALTVLVGTGGIVIFSAQAPDTPVAGVTDEAGIETGPDSTAQPIAFSHSRHIREIGIDCQFCHAYPRRGPVAGIPSVQNCVGCHQTVLSDRPEILKVLEYWEHEIPIPWVRVHDLPDYVRFSHKPHVRSGVHCETCHGDVATMEAAIQVESLSMGWCLNCHEDRGATRDCLACHH